jgi:hypothetical protein
MPFSGNTYTPPAGAESAAPGQVVQSAVWDAIFTDLASALTQVMNQFNAGPVSINGVGTTQSGAAAIGALQFYVRGNAQSGQYAFVMPSVAVTGNRFEIFNSGAATGVIWPPSGGVVNTTATGLSVAALKGITFLTVSASTFDAVLSL